MDKMIICFDLDGTLVDTHNWNVNAQLKSFKKNGIKVTRKRIYNMWGLTLTDQIKQTSPKTKKERISQIREDFENLRKESLKGIKPYKNTKKNFKTIIKKVYPMPSK
ncbi:HAD hydrolase-like protein [archaeon]|nr:HAD hydrolase-like protein [archaeon]